MAVSFFTDNKFGFSRFTRKKNVFIRSVFLTLVKNYSQRTALFYVLTILPVLVLGVVKRKPSSLFRSWGSAPPSSNHCHQRSLHRIQRAGLLQKLQMKIHFFFHHLVALHCHSLPWIQLQILVSQTIIIKNHGSGRLPKSRFTRNITSNSRFTKIPFTTLIVIVIAFIYTRFKSTAELMWSC